MSANQWASQATTPNAALIRHERASVIVVWVMHVALAALCLIVGGTTLTGTPATAANMFLAAGWTAPTVNVFNAVVLGLWGYYVIGVAEVTAAIVLLRPSAAPYAALLLIPIMIGAIADNVFLLQASPVAPLVLVIGAAAVVFAHREQFLRALGPHITT